MKKIFLCIPTLHGGGAERVFKYIIEYLDKAEYQIQLVLLQNSKGLPSLFHKKGVVTHNLNCRLPLAFLKLPLLILKEKPDIVLSTICYMNIVTGFCSWLLKSSNSIFIARESGIPSIRVQYTKTFWNSPWLYKLAYKHFDCVICQSKDMAREVHELYKVPTELIFTISNPVDTNFVRSQASGNSPLSFSKSMINILAVGRLHPQKGYDLLIQALARTTKKNAHLHILGTGGIFDQLTILVENLGLSDRVSFYGYVNNPYPFMRNADLFVISSIAEGFPNSLLEALALGCPSIAFNGIGGTKELIEQGVNGSLVELGNIDLLASEIDRCSSALFDRKRIASEIAIRYDVFTIIKKYESVFLRTISRKQFH